ncbi:hypothetical protein CRM22_000921 [Opisthorchis felineus]|uniref:Uncharacterized protein n=1 Tax=Opisthorchis felineus TaxID=147828 RepID=A0A4S2MCU8_OPIFE|nr:hypothetical protein CRM22_000921 [Opisthorchis felineus]
MQMMHLFGADSILDRDRLALAVYLARRDVAQLVSGTGMQPAKDKKTKTLVQRPSISTKSTTQSRVTVRPCSAEHTLVPDCANEPLRVESVGLTSSTAISHGVPQEKRPEHPPESLPARGTSPPTRDLDSCNTPHRTRPLHAPTEKQLQCAKDSHLRQLQAKIARYSSALADLRIRPTETTRTRPETNGTEPVMRQPPVRPRNSLSLRPAPRKSRSASFLQQNVVPLGFKMHSRPNSFRPGISSWRSNHGRSVSETHRKSAVPSKQQKIREQVDALWAEARQSLSVVDSEVVVLEPDQENPIQNLNDIPPVNASPYVIPGETQKENSQLGTKHARFHTESPKKIERLKTTHHSVRPSTKKEQSKEVTNGVPLSVDDVLNQLDEAEAEENSIRHRWAHLSFGLDRGRRPSVKKEYDFSDASVTTPRPILIPNRPEAQSGRRQNTLLKKTAEGRLSPPGSTPIVFTKTVPDATYASKRTQSPLKAQDSSYFANSRFTLRLPTQLHRKLLLESARRHRHFVMVCEQRNILTAEDCKNVHPARVCEWLADELVDQLLSEVVEDIERETSELVEEIVEGELHTEAHDSTLTTHSNVSDLDDGHLPTGTPLPGMGNQLAIVETSEPKPHFTPRSDLSSTHTPMKNSLQQFRDELTVLTSSKERQSTKAGPTQYSLEFDESATGQNCSTIHSSYQADAARISDGHFNESRSLSSATLIATQALHQACESMDDLTDRIIDSPLPSQ